MTRPSSSSPGRGAVVACAVVAVAFAMGPTPGDVGACGRTAEELDRNNYAEARKLTECERCGKCGIDNARCQQACDSAKPPTVALPSTCRPVLHDGEVCLRALSAASCSTFATYVDDVAPVSPTECDFCKVAPPEPSGSFGGDAGAEAGR